MGACSQITVFTFAVMRRTPAAGLLEYIIPLLYLPVFTIWVSATKQASHTHKLFTLRQKKGTEKLDPISCAHTEAKEWVQAELVRSTAILRYEPCPQFINVSQRALHIYWQFSAMSHAIHKIVSKRRCQSYFISRRSPHHGISKDSDLCASAHRCPHYAYARLIARVNSPVTILNPLLYFSPESV